MKDITFEDTISHQWRDHDEDSVEARAIADVMSRHDHIRVTIHARHDPHSTATANGFQMDEISEELGPGHDPASFEFQHRRITAAWS